MEKNNLFTFISYFVLVAYMILSLYYAIVPLHLPKLIEFDSRRLVWHFSEYIVLSFLLLNATRNKRLSLIACLIYGAALEIVQLWVPTRVFDLFDLSANLLGGVVGIFSLANLFKLRK